MPSDDTAITSRRLHLFTASATPAARIERSFRRRRQHTAARYRRMARRKSPPARWAMACRDATTRRSHASACVERSNEMAWSPPLATTMAAAEKREIGYRRARPPLCFSSKCRAMKLLHFCRIAVATSYKCQLGLDDIFRSAAVSLRHFSRSRFLLPPRSPNRRFAKT